MRQTIWYLKPFVILSALFLLSFFLHFFLLQKTSFATGWDGYYYLIQVKSFLLEGKMHSPDAALFYPLLIFFTRLFSDALFALKFLSALMAAFFIPAAYFCVRRFFPSEPEEAQWSSSVALLMAAYFLFSPVLFYLAAHFPKNLLGFLFLLLFIGSMARLHALFFSGPFPAKTLLSSLALSFCFIIAAFLSHRLSAALAFLFCGLYLVYFLVKTRRFSWFLLLIPGIFLFWLLTRTFPGLLHLSDILRLEGLFSSSAQFAPLSFIALLGLSKIHPLWLLEIVLLVLGWPCFFFLRAKDKSTSLPLFLLAFFPFLLLFPFFQFDLLGAAFRFLLAFFILAPFFLLPLLKRLKKGLPLAAAALLLAAPLNLLLYSHASLDPPYAYYQQLAAKIFAVPDAVSAELLVAHKGLAEYITYTADKDALPWKPEDRFDKKRTWRVASGFSSTDFALYLSPGEHSLLHPLSSYYHLIREDVYESFLDRIKEDLREDLLLLACSWQNPFEVRPFFITRLRHE